MMGDTAELNIHDLLALLQDTRALSSEIDLDQLLESILQRACDLTESPSGSVILYDERQDGLYFAAATGPKAAAALDLFGENAPKRIPLVGSKAGQVFCSGETIVEQAILADPDHFKAVDQQTNYLTESMLCVPLAIGGERIGVVQLLNKTSGDYTRRDTVLLENFASHAALAVRNARLVKELLAHKGLFTSSAPGQKITDLIRELSAPARRERMTVMFADMRGFTRFSQTLGDPGEIEQHLNEFITLLASAVVRHEGFVNKFLGDGVLALFRGPDAEKRCIWCAFDIIDSFFKLKSDWDRTRAEALEFLDVGVGIVTGDVIIGSIGSGMVRDFTALGNAVNLAAAFEQDARGGNRVLVDQNTYNQIGDIIEAADDPTVYEMRKPDQPFGVSYKRYHIRGVKRDIRPDGAVPAQAGTHGLDGYYRSSWAILIGVNEYKSPKISKLSYAVSDVRAVAKALPKVGFSPQHIQILENEHATRHNIQQAIYGNLTEAELTDRLLIFFAVHGQVLQHHAGEEGFLLPYDADPENLPLTGLPMVELAQMGRRLRPKHILFVVDSCFSGYAARREANTMGSQLNLKELTRERVVEVLTAGTTGQKAAEDGGHGIFTRALLKGLEGWADPEGHGLTALKLAAYLQERLVPKGQNPQVSKLDGEGEFLFLPPREKGIQG